MVVEGDEEEERESRRDKRDQKVSQVRIGGAVACNEVERGHVRQAPEKVGTPSRRQPAWNAALKPCPYLAIKQRDTAYQRVWHRDFCDRVCGLAGCTNAKYHTRIP